MPARGKGRRTATESRAFKSEIIKLRAQDKSIVKIAEQMGVSRQYVSLVLNEAGLGGKLRKKREISINGMEDDPETNVSRLEQHGEHALASLLRAVTQRCKE
jgi:transposase-like protein